MVELSAGVPGRPAAGDPLRAGESAVITGSWLWPGHLRSEPAGGKPLSLSLLHPLPALEMETESILEVNKWLICKKWVPRGKAESLQVKTELKPWHSSSFHVWCFGRGWVIMGYNGLLSSTQKLRFRLPLIWISACTAEERTYVTYLNVYKTCWKWFLICPVDI